MHPVIVCIAKLEQDYIKEFVNYHLHIGFKTIYIYDNEDIPTYENFLKEYSTNIKVIHLPHNNYEKGVQYIALDHFVNHFLYNDNITHVAHIDVDEFIVLKKHKNICEFIKEYFVNNCGAIGMNWRFFGSSNQTQKTNIPVTIRFTMCEKNGNRHIKTLFDKNYFVRYDNVHYIITKPNYYTKSTNGSIINGPFNDNIDFNIIQLNHYKSKTFPEFQQARTRQRADINGPINENIIESFNHHNINEISDYSAYHFYKTIQ
jgi:hypothetical protein